MLVNNINEVIISVVQRQDRQITQGRQTLTWLQIHLEIIPQHLYGKEVSKALCDCQISGGEEQVGKKEEAMCGSTGLDNVTPTTWQQNFYYVTNTWHYQLQLVPHVSPKRILSLWQHIRF